MQVISAVSVNALLTASLILVIGVPVLFSIQPAPADRNRKVGIISGVWLAMLALTTLTSALV